MDKVPSNFKVTSENEPNRARYRSPNYKLDLALAKLKCKNFFLG